MANPVLHRTLQEYGTGSAVALALTQYSGMVVSAFHQATEFARYVFTKPITNGRTYQFPAVAQATAENLIPGVERVGNNEPELENRTVTLDTYQTISDAYEAECDEFIRHFEVRNIVAQEHAEACAKEVDLKLARMIAVGARESDVGSGVDLFEGGHTITASTSGAVTTAYPVSLTGSQRLQSDLGAMAQEFDERNISRENRIAFMRPYLNRVLLLDKTLVSKDYQGINEMLPRKLVECEGWKIVVTNNIPSDNDTSNSNLDTIYKADYSKVHVLCIGDPLAVGQITAMGSVRPINPVWQDTKHAWYMGAKIWQGCKWIRKEACGEIVTDT